MRNAAFETAQDKPDTHGNQSNVIDDLKINRIGAVCPQNRKEGRRLKEGREWRQYRQFFAFPTQPQRRAN